MAKYLLKELFRMVAEDDPDATYVYYVLLELKKRLGVSRIKYIGWALWEGDEEDFDADFWNSVKKKAWIAFRNDYPSLARKVDRERATKLLEDVIDYLIDKARQGFWEM